MTTVTATLVRRKLQCGEGGSCGVPEDVVVLLLLMLVMVVMAMVVMVIEVVV